MDEPLFPDERPVLQFLVVAQLTPRNGWGLSMRFRREGQALMDASSLIYDHLSPLELIQVLEAEVGRWLDA